MADDKTKTGIADDIRINSNESYDLQYWSEKLGVTRDELREAVKAAGPMVSDVRRELGK
jgi:hypothetical protein